MKFFIFFIFLCNLIYCQDSTLDGFLKSDYPFSYKIGYNEVNIFQQTCITTYKLLPNTIFDTPLDGACLSGLEKGFIYNKGYYYTSCKTDENSFEFNVNIYEKVGGALSCCTTITHTEPGCQLWRCSSWHS